MPLLRSLRSLLTTVALGVVVVVSPLATLPAAADAAGPSDYRTRVVSIDPPVAGLRIDIVGGDSFVQLTAPKGLTITVLGYEGEPYLRFLPDGTVEENTATTTTVLNRSRYGTSTAGTNASAQATPQWERVAGNGSYAWHDHRSHWMSPSRPPGKHPGDVVAEGVIPLRVDGESVSVHLETAWLAAPSRVSVWVGALGGAALWGAALVLARRIEFATAITDAVVSLGALVVGVVAYTSVPAVTGRRFAEWALPAAAALLSVSAALVARRRAPLAAAFVTASSVQLLGWGWWRRSGLWKASLPTNLSAPADRAVTAAALTVGALGALTAGWTLVRPLPPPDPADTFRAHTPRET
jgi:hypothetical protein